MQELFTACKSYGVSPMVALQTCKQRGVPIAPTLLPPLRVTLEVGSGTAVADHIQDHIASPTPSPEPRRHLRHDSSYGKFANDSRSCTPTDMSADDTAGR